MYSKSNCINQFPSLTTDRSFGRSLDPIRLNELAAVSEYIYQSIIFEDIYPELSDVYNNIAMQEMEHYKLLSELQLCLGVNPCINTRINVRPIDLTEDRDSIAPRAALRSLRCFIQSETASAQEYRRLSAEASDCDISRLLSEFADDEESHAAELSVYESSIITN